MLNIDLTGKTAVITGASGVIGGAIAQSLIDAGANVALTYYSNRKPIEVFIAKQNCIGKIKGYQVDNTVPDEIAAHAEKVIFDFDAIDILINCAGGHLPGSISDLSTTFFDLDPQIMDKNVSFNLLSGCIWPCYFYGKKMVKNNNGGAIINISSMNAYRPLQGRASYAAAKSGVGNFTQWFASTIAREFNNKIRVNCIAPGFFPGPHNLGVMTNEDGSLAWRGKKIVERTPMGRLANPEDIVGTMLFLVSDMSKYVTGTMIPVDGGFMAESGL